MTCACLGGDEFAVLLENANHERVAAIAIQLGQALSEPFAAASISLRTNASIGIAMCPDHGDELNRREALCGRLSCTARARPGTVHTIIMAAELAAKCADFCISGRTPPDVITPLTCTYGRQWPTTNAGRRL